MDQADGQSVKLHVSNKIMVSSWMGDQWFVYSSWIIFSRWKFSCKSNLIFWKNYPPGKKFQVEKFAYFASFCYYI